MRRPVVAGLDILFLYGFLDGLIVNRITFCIGEISTQLGVCSYVLSKPMGHDIFQSSRWKMLTAAIGLRIDTKKRGFVELCRTFLGVFHHPICEV